MNTMMKSLLGFIGLLVIGGIVVYALGAYRAEKAPAVAVVPPIQEQVPEKPRTFHLYAVGDIMLDRGVERKVIAAGKDYTLPFQLISQDLKKADLVFANHEGPMSDLGSDQGGKYSFRFDTQFAQPLADSGIDVVSLANNHMHDWGGLALCDTPEELAAVGIKSVGAGCNETEANEPLLVTLEDGTVIAFVAYQNLYPQSWSAAKGDRPGMSLYEREQSIETVRALAARSDIDLVMVSIHWGTEYETKSNAAQQSLGRAWIDAGADVVIGHHPHVAQEIEKYENGWIIYSLGNFIFDQSWSDETMKGLLADIQIIDGMVTNVVGMPIQLTSDFQPYIVK